MTPIQKTNTSYRILTMSTHCKLSTREACMRIASASLASQYQILISSDDRQIKLVRQPECPPPVIQHTTTVRCSCSSFLIVLGRYRLKVLVLTLSPIVMLSNFSRFHEWHIPNQLQNLKFGPFQCHASVKRLELMTFFNEFIYNIVMNHEVVLRL